MPPEPERFPLDLPLPPRLAAAIARLEDNGGRCRIVGGSIRDTLLGLHPKDFDVEVYGLDLAAIAKILSSQGKTDLVGKAFAVVKLWTHGAEYDFSIPRREAKTGVGHPAFAIEADVSMSEAEALTRRDFTINALLYDPKRGEVIDYYGGKQDLDNRLLRHVSPAFSEDPLRVLRAMQFAGRFQLTLHPETAELCRSIGHEFWSLPAERVYGEWEKWACRSRSLSHGMRALQDSGWIRYFPELNALRDLPQEPEWHPEGDAWTHTLCCLDALANETDWATLPNEERGVLAFAVLCHDLGKARCTRYTLKHGTKRWISPGHETASVWLAQRFLDAMRSPHLLRDKVMNLVGNHHFLNTGHPGPPSNASIRRLTSRLRPATARELIYVMTADHLGRPPLRSEHQEARIAAFQQKLDELDLKDDSPKPILLGRHLIAAGLAPGPDFKPILDAAFEAQLEGIFDTETAALAWLDDTLEGDRSDRTRAQTNL